MTNLPFSHPTAGNRPIDPAAAAQMLTEADRVSQRAAEGIDPGPLVVIRRWTPVVLFIYAVSFLLVFSDQGSASAPNPLLPGAKYANLLIIPLLMQIQLVQGARNRLPIADISMSRGRTILQLLTVVPFIAILAVSLFGVKIPWWVCILVAVGVAAPSLREVGTRAHKSSGYTRGQRTPSPVLSSTARATSFVLGIYLGAASAVMVFPWFPLAALPMLILLLVSVCFANKRWGLTSVGSEWQARHWVAFGISFVLFFAFVLLVVKTSWNTPLVGILGGAAIALPLVISAATSRSKP
ncbi:hypothetical protein [Arthrobacter antibioticus]|uniref:hypothetical protein n=2 Tax=unclassified Arthrobacter TaxID=235627 RepID=UPI0024BBEA39|nr:hypothetical protein [Arthrobacter sp. H35-MC1]MDJ0316300.1 hypothetical protein [Arthrobacter sp. H35-MC1]